MSQRTVCPQQESGSSGAVLDAAFPLLVSSPAYRLAGPCAVADDPDVDLKYSH